MPTVGAVRKLAVRGAGAMIFSSGITLGVQIASTLVLARILMPSDFGLIAMVTTFSLLLTNFGLNGFTEAVLQSDEMNHNIASNLFWINLSAGILLSCVFAAAGPLLARFYKQVSLTHLAIGVAFSIFITSSSVIHLALLRRAMRFGVVSINDIVAKFVSVAVSIALAVAGWGVWALVAGVVVLPLSQAIGAWYLCSWVPGAPHRENATNGLVKFSLSVYGRFAVNYMARNADNFLVGWRFGAFSLGFYKRAYDLFALPASQIGSPLSNVAVSALSRFKNDAQKFRHHLLAGIALMAFVGMGLGADLTLTGQEVIRLVLGHKWGEAGRIFTFFGPGVGVMLVYYTQSWIHLSIGRADRWLRWSIMESTFTCLLFVAALPWGPTGIAFAWTASFSLLLLPSLAYAAEPVGIGVGAFASCIWRYIVAAAAAGVTTSLLMRIHVPFDTITAVRAFKRIIAISALFWVLYLLAVIALFRGYGSIIQLVNVLKEMLPQSVLARFNSQVAPEGKAPVPVPASDEKEYEVSASPVD